MTIIYVELLDEGVDVWRPVEAEHLGADRYRIIDGPPSGERWAFARNEVVRCKFKKLSGDWGKESDCLIAFEKAT